MNLNEKNISYFSQNANRFPMVDGLDRSLAMNLYQGLGFPHAKMEKWQKSKIRKVLKEDFDLQSQELATAKMPEDIFIEEAVKIHFINGAHSGESKMIKSENACLVGSIGAAIQEYPELVKQHLNRYVKEDLNGLNALNNASFQQGLFLYIPKNVQAEIPVHWLNQYAGEMSLFTQLRNLIIVDSGASMTLLTSDEGEGNGRVFTNSVSEIFVGANARFKWYRDQDLRKNDSMVNSVFCHMERDAYCNIINTTLHGSMVRNDVHIKMDGEGCDANILGLYLPHSGEQVDNQVFMEHAKPHCVSNELFKGVLDGKGESIFNGHILVAQDAQKTNAYQTNRNVVLSDEANAFAKPFLEIYADDVRCSHGATVGQLDEKALFYLRSRGLSMEQARSFLIKAFVGEVIEQCDHEAFRNIMEKKVNAKLAEK
jgi:Fe-S cluster assembly protein SufD